jgi:uncharacterized protein
MSRNNFRQLLSFAIAICLTLVMSPPAWGISIENIPNPRQVNGTWVEDTAGILSDRVEDALNALISQSEAHNSAEIAVVTVSETSPSASPKEFATQLFNHWGIALFCHSPNSRHMKNCYFSHYYNKEIIEQ